NWPEKAEWSWRFKDKDTWLRLTIPNGKFFRGGELRYLPKEEEYKFTARDPEGNELVFRGKFKGKRLILDRTDPKNNETQEIHMNLAAGGIRFVYAYLVKPAERTSFSRRFQVVFTKEGETFATAKNKVECVVTGGLGTIPVSYNGVTYYVCCSGCRD